MRSIIFANYLGECLSWTGVLHDSTAHAVASLSRRSSQHQSPGADKCVPTAAAVASSGPCSNRGTTPGPPCPLCAVDVQQSSIRFLGNLVLSLWDCGGQDAFYESYFDSQRSNIFPNVAVLIYVFDIESPDLEKDFRYYEGCVDALGANSPDSRIFCLVHKMDLVPEDIRGQIFQERADLIASRSRGHPVQCFATSIWDETLYRAWSSIVYSLIPNVSRLETHLAELANACSADEVVVFEKATFLVIASTSPTPHPDAHRFEKISNIVKQFKLTCSKCSAQFQAMTVSNASFTALIDEFTSNTYVMIVTTGPATRVEATSLNIAIAKGHFEKLIAQQTSGLSTSMPLPQASSLSADASVLDTSISAALGSSPADVSVLSAAAAGGGDAGM